MRKKIILAVMMIILLSLPTQIKAHPGRTDSNGCHTCRTNCDKWGLSTGEYHCHNGGGSTSGNQSSLISNGTSQSQEQTNTVVQQPVQPVTPKINYASEGEKDGYNFKMKYPNKELSEAEYTYENDDYKEAFNDSFQKAEDEIKSNTIKLASENGKQDAISTETYQLDQLPSNIIEKVYVEYYKESYDTKEQEYYNEIEANAKSNAYAMIYNEEDKNEKTYDLDKFKQYYKEAYEKYISKYTEEKNELLETASKMGEEDGKAGEEADYSFLEKIKNTKLYQEAKDVYQKSYDENKSNNSLLIGTITVAIFGIIVIGIIIKIRKKK
ncbi:YHYH domain-containing protein [Erysipelotrichaceae bacterium HCN-30851]